MYRLKWPVNFSSIIKWARTNLPVFKGKTYRADKKAAKMAVLAVLLITLLIGANTLFWHKLPTEALTWPGSRARINPEWEIDLNEQVLDEEELRREYTVINPNEEVIQEESPEVAEAPPEKAEPEIKQDEEPEEKVSNQAPEAKTQPKETAPASVLATMAMPTMGKVITAFAMDTLVYSKTLEQWNAHPGIDIAADLGTQVKSAMKGTVAEVRSNDPRLGVVVILDHGGGIQTLYGNLQSDKLVKKGDTVEKGQVIGAVGKTAPFEIEDPPHLHFEVIKDGKNIDPGQYLPKLN